MLSNAAPSTIFWVFGMARPGIEPWSSEPLANTLLTGPLLQNWNQPKIWICNSPKITQPSINIYAVFTFDYRCCKIYHYDIISLIWSPIEKQEMLLENEKNQESRIYKANYYGICSFQSKKGCELSFLKESKNNSRYKKKNLISFLLCTREERPDQESLITLHLKKTGECACWNIVWTTKARCSIVWIIEYLWLVWYYKLSFCSSFTLSFFSFTITFFTSVLSPVSPPHTPVFLSFQLILLFGSHDFFLSDTPLFTQVMPLVTIIKFLVTL